MDGKIKEQLRDYYSYWLGMNDMYEKWAKTKELSLNSLFILYALANTEGVCTQKRICDEWQMPKQTVNTILKHFEKEGKVMICTQSTDKRNKEIFFTAEGEKFADLILEELYCFEKKVMKKLGKENCDIFLKMNRLFLETFREAMEELET